MFVPHERMFSGTEFSSMQCILLFDRSGLLFSRFDGYTGVFSQSL